MYNKGKATLYMIISVVCFTSMQVFVGITDPQVSVFQQVFFRNLIGIGVSYLFLRKTGESYLGAKKFQPYLFTRSFFGVLGLLFSFYALRNANIADATVVTRTGPIFTTLFSVLFLKERTTKLQVTLLFVIFAGGWLAANPRFDSSFIPLAAAFISAIYNGICYMLLRYFNGRVHAMTVVMHFSIFSVVSCLPFLIADFYLPQGIDIFFLFCIALTGSLGQVFLTYAYRFAPASEVAIFDQLAVPLAVVFGIAFMNQVPTPMVLLGGLLIVGSSLVSYFFNKRNLGTK